MFCYVLTVLSWYFYHIFVSILNTMLKTAGTKGNSEEIFKLALVLTTATITDLWMFFFFSEINRRAKRENSIQVKY